MRPVEVEAKMSKRDNITVKSTRWSGSGKGTLAKITYIGISCALKKLYMKRPTRNSFALQLETIIINCSQNLKHAQQNKFSWNIENFKKSENCSFQLPSDYLLCIPRVSRYMLASSILPNLRYVKLKLLPSLSFVALVPVAIQVQP